MNNDTGGIALQLHVRFLYLIIVFLCNFSHVTLSNKIQGNRLRVKCYLDRKLRKIVNIIDK